MQYSCFTWIYCLQSIEEERQINAKKKEKVHSFITFEKEMKQFYSHSRRRPTIPFIYLFVIFFYLSAYSYLQACKNKQEQQWHYCRATPELNALLKASSQSKGTVIKLYGSPSAP